MEILPFLVLLLLCLLVVFRVLPYIPVLLCVAVAVAVLNRRLYLEVDYFLLFTFLFFFIFVGNLKRIPLVSEALISAVKGRELLTGVLASQVISNVPAAILLSGFTDRIQPLLTGVNLGGLGTLIASLASLISYKIVTREYPRSRGRFLKVLHSGTFCFLRCCFWRRCSWAGCRDNIFYGQSACRLFFHISELFYHIKSFPGRIFIYWK